MIGDSKEQWLLSVNAHVWTSQVVLLVQNLPANAGDVRDVGSIPGSGRSPGGGRGNHFSILASRLPWTEEPGGATVHRVAESDATEAA